MASAENIVGYIADVFVVFAGITALVTYLREVALRIEREDEGKVCSQKSVMGKFKTERAPSLWGYFWRRKKKTEIPKVATIAAFIRDGDNLAYTSAMFDRIPSSSRESGKRCWVNLYTEYYATAGLQFSQPRTDEDTVDYSKPLKTINDKPAVASYFNDTKRLQKLANHPVQGIVSKAEIHTETPKRKYDTQIELDCSIDTERQQTQTDRPPQSLKSLFKLFFKFYNTRKLDDVSQSERELVCCVRSLDNPESKAVGCKAPETKSTDTKALKSKTPDLSGSTHRRKLWLVKGQPCIEISREELAGFALVLGIPLTMDNDNEAAVTTICGTGPFGVHIRGRIVGLDWRLHLTLQHKQVTHRPSEGSGYSTLFAKHIACGCIPFSQSLSWTDTIFVDEPAFKAIRNSAYKIVPHESVGIDPALRYLSRLPAARGLSVYHVQGIEDKEMRNDEHVSMWLNAVAGIAFGGLVPQSSQFLWKAVLFTVTSETIKDDKFIQSTRLLKGLQDLVDEAHKASQGLKRLRLFGELVENRVQAKHSKFHPLPESDCEYSATPRHVGALFSRYMTLLERLTWLWKPKVEDPTIVKEVYDECCILLASGKAKDNLLEKDVQDVLEKVKHKQDITKVDCAKIARCIIAAWAYRVPDSQNLTDEAFHNLPTVSALG